MGVAGQRQRHPFGHVGEDVGFVGQQDDRRIVRHLRQRSAEVVEPDECLRFQALPGRSASWSARPAIQNAVAVLLEPHDVVLQHRNAGRLQRLAGDRRAVPAFCADRSSHQSWLPRTDSTPSGAFRPGQRRRPLRRIDPVRHHSRAGDIVAEQHDQVRLKAFASLDQRGDPLRRHPWPAGMDVGKRDDAQLQTRPASPAASASSASHASAASARCRPHRR